MVFLREVKVLKLQSGFGMDFLFLYLQDRSNAKQNLSHITQLPALRSPNTPTSK